MLYKDSSGKILDEKKRIIPFVKEVSFAFNPCNKRSFFMMKEKNMDELLKILQDAEPLTKEDVIVKMLAKEKVSPEAEAAVLGALRLITKHKDALPKGIFVSLAKEVPEYVDLVGQLDKACSPEEIDKIKKGLEKELREKLEKEFAGDDAKLSEAMQLMKDQIALMAKELKDTKVELQKEQDERAKTDIQNQLLKDNFVGDMVKATEIVLTLRKENPKLADAYMEQQKAMGSFISGDLGVEVGRNQAGLLVKDTSFPGAANYAKLEAKVQEMLKETPEMSPTRAMKKVINDNPVLYKAYRDSLK